MSGDIESDDRRIKRLTIEAQLEREFSERLDIEADGWLREAMSKRQKAIEHRMQAEALTQQAHLIRTARKGLTGKSARVVVTDDVQ